MPGLARGRREDNVRPLRRVRRPFRQGTRRRGDPRPWSGVEGESLCDHARRTRCEYRTMMRATLRFLAGMVAFAAAIAGAAIWTLVAAAFLSH